MRVVVFTDLSGDVPRTLLSALLRIADERDDVEVAGFVTDNEALAAPLGLRSRVRPLLRAALLRGFSSSATASPTLDLGRIARRRSVPVLRSERKVNSPAFIDRLHRELRPDVLVCLFCLQILRAPLLDSVEQAVNYHDGTLPQYRGLGATAHSIYNGDPRSGFTFHRMTPGIDDGPVLLGGSVPVPALGPAWAVHRAKTREAARRLPEVVEMIARNEPGTPQRGLVGYYDRAAYDAIAVVSDPSLLSADELQRRLRACGTVTMPIGGRNEQVTAIEPASSTTGRWCFAGAEGRPLRVTEVRGLPTWMVDARRGWAQTRGR